MKRALVLNTINPRIGGVLIRGEKGTAKSTAVRALASLLPEIDVIAGCPYACDPAARDTWCEECQARFPLTPQPPLPQGARGRRGTGGVGASPSSPAKPEVGTSADRTSPSPRRGRGGQGGEGELATRRVPLVELPVGATEDFFALGGHSLLAIKAIRLINEKLDVALTFADFLRHSTVRRSAAACSEPGGLTIPTLPPAADAPLSYAQRTLWACERTNPKTDAWGAPLPLSVKPCQTSTVLTALRTLLLHHDALRTEFRLEGDGVTPTQRIVPVDAIPFETDARGRRSGPPRSPSRRTGPCRARWSAPT